MDTDVCGHVGWLMCCLQTQMSVNKKEKKYTYLMVDMDVLRSSVLA